MELTKKTFIERLQYLQGELRAIAQSDELRQLVQSNYYDPDLTIIDAIHAVSEVVYSYQLQETYRAFKMPRPVQNPDSK